MASKQDETIDQVRSRLERAGKADRYIRVTRFMPGAEALDGFVLDVGAKWVSMAVIQSGRVNGFSTFRLRDVARVSARRQDERFVEQSLRLDETWPPPGPSFAVPLDSTQSLVHALAVESALVGLHIEYQEPDVMFVGIPTRPRKRRFTMAEITAQGEWDEDLSRWGVDEVSRIDFADDYLRRLATVAGPPEF